MWFCTTFFSLMHRNVLFVEKTNPLIAISYYILYHETFVLIFFFFCFSEKSMRIFIFFDYSLINIQNIIILFFLVYHAFATVQVFFHEYVCHTFLLFLCVTLKKSLDSIFRICIPSVLFVFVLCGVKKNYIITLFNIIHFFLQLLNLHMRCNMMKHGKTKSSALFIHIHHDINNILVLSSRVK